MTFLPTLCSNFAQTVDRSISIVQSMSLRSRRVRRSRYSTPSQRPDTRSLPTRRPPLGLPAKTSCWVRRCLSDVHLCATLSKLITINVSLVA